MGAGSFDHLVTAPHRGRTPATLAALPVDALKGVSAADRQALRAAFGIETVEDLATNRFVRAARSIHHEADGAAHDPGPDPDLAAFLGAAPLDVYQAHPDRFRLDFGPVYYRGRLDDTARVLVVGQDPAPNELVGHRAFVGASGQRIQGFLRRLGIRRDYLMINTFLYPVFGQFSTELRALTRDPEILGFRNAWLDRIAARNPLQAVIAVGSAARDAVERWPGRGDVPLQSITHPSARDHAALLASWNQGLDALRAVVAPEVDAPADPSMYGTDFVATDHEPIPRRDLPFGVPHWHGVGDHATRARHDDGSTDDKRIVWQAP